MVRRLGWVGLAAGAALFALVLRGYGQDTLTQPWNPYLPVVAWVVVLLATWCVLCGDAVALVPLVVAATYCAQTHVPYLPLGVGMVVLAAVATIVLWRRAEPPGRRRWRIGQPLGRRHRRRAVAAAGGRPDPQRRRATSAPCSTTSARRPNRPSASATASRSPCATST